MIDPKDYAAVQAQLQAHLAEKIDGVAVQIGDGIHYKGTNVVVTAPGFAGLLPEQRFFRVVRAIPTEFYERYLQGGVVWFELAPGESGKDYMKLPRAVDVAGQEGVVLDQLAGVGFFAKLRARLGPDPKAASADDLVVSREVLIEAGLSEADVTRACLILIRHGGYCDAQVLTEALPAISGL